jgi:hypothetical protein
MLLAGYKMFNYLNQKIMGSQTMVQIVGFALLLFAACGTFIAGGLFTLVKIFTFLL